MTTSKDELSLPIVVKESKTTISNIKLTDIESKALLENKDERLQKILSESVSDDEKLKMIRESYKFQFSEDEDITAEHPIIKEWNLSWAGKLFFAGAAAYIAGKVVKNMPLKIKGTKEQLRAIADAIVASKEFQDELKRPNASIESVVKKMNLKNVTRERFTSMTGKSFPL